MNNKVKGLMRYKSIMAIVCIYVFIVLVIPVLALRPTYVTFYGLDPSYNVGSNIDFYFSQVSDPEFDIIYGYVCKNGIIANPATVMPADCTGVCLNEAIWGCTQESSGDLNVLYAAQAADIGPNNYVAFIMDEYNYVNLAIESGSFYVCDNSQPESNVPTNCADTYDNDCDNDIDCEDSDCNGLPGPGGIACENPETSCNDNNDNDGDHLVDCQDPDCSADLACSGATCTPDGCNNNCPYGCDSADCGSGAGQDPDCCTDPNDYCNDGCQNRDETDVDCGGSCSTKCGNGDSCDVNGDCNSGFCDPSSNTCEAPTCSDGFKNQGESGVDCGGPCAGADDEDTLSECTDNLDNDNDCGADCSDPDNNCNTWCTCPDGACSYGEVCQADCTAGGMHEGNIGADLCKDGADNDEQNGADCADINCHFQDGSAALGIQRCEHAYSGGEQTCNDGFDNDADQGADCADTDCSNKQCGSLSNHICCFGSCINTKSDKNHCGGCGIDCVTKLGANGACQSGTCIDLSPPVSGAVTGAPGFEFGLLSLLIAVVISSAFFFVRA